MNSSSTRPTHNFREALSWRGPFIVTLLALREIMRPVLYWHAWHIFETDTSTQISQPYGREEAEVCFYSADNCPSSVCQQIAAMGELELSEVARRLADRWCVAVAFAKEQPVGYMWIILSSGIELAFDTYWIVRQGEALRFGSFVPPEFRGKRIHSILNHAVLCYLRGRNIDTALASISVLNSQSMSLARHNKRAIAMTVFVARIRKLNWTFRKSFGAPLASRFSCSPH
jgi:GNAT superfamily N-acetyltransferase